MYFYGKKKKYYFVELKKICLYLALVTKSKILRFSIFQFNKDENIHRFVVRGELLEREREFRQVETKRMTQKVFHKKHDSKIIT